MPAFRTPSGVPYADINLGTGHAKGPAWSTDSTTSEVATIQLEFRDLTKSSGDKKYRVRYLKLCQNVITMLVCLFFLVPSFCFI